MVRKYFGQRTDEGLVFWDKDAFNNRPDDVCYIAECVMLSGDTQYDADNNPFIVIDDKDIPKLISEGGVSTHNSIREEVKSFCQKITDDENFIEYMSACSFANCEWECMCTYLSQCDIEEEYNYWLNSCKRKKGNNYGNAM